MPRLLQITDKDVGGGGIRRAVEIQADLLCARGWHCERMRLGKGAAQAEDIIAPPPHPVADTPQKWRSALERHRNDFDVIHLHLGFSRLSPGFVWAAADLAPLVVNLHDISPFIQGAGTGLRDWFSGQVMKAARTRVLAALRDCAVMVIAPSRFLATQAESAGIPAGRIRVIPHAVHTPTKVPERPSSRPPIAVYAGLLSRQKGAEILLEAFARLTSRSAGLWILGDGPLADNIAKWIVAKGLTDRVILAGRVDPAAVRAAMSKTRLVIHPSLIDEGFGLTGLEALAEGRPVAGFGTGGTVDWLIDGETGLRAASVSADDLAAVWQRLLDDGKLADRLGRNGYALVAAQFSPQAVGDMLDTVLREALGMSVAS